MSWSLSLVAPKAEARAKFVEAHRAQPAYKASGAHEVVMDRIAAFAGDLAEAAPDCTDCSLSSSGHVGDDGTGSASISISFFKPVPKA